MKNKDTAMRETSAENWTLEQPSPSQPTAHGFLYTRLDGSRVYVTENRTVARRFLAWGWPLHPHYTEDWCRRTGTYLFHVPTDWHVLRAEPIAVKNTAAYKWWKQAAIPAAPRRPKRAVETDGADGVDSADEEFVPCPYLQQLPEAGAQAQTPQSRVNRQRELVRGSQMRLDRRWWYRNERYEKRGMLWIPVRIDTWELRWPKMVKPDSIQMDDERFSDYVRSGNVYGYDGFANPNFAHWFGYKGITSPSLITLAPGFVLDERFTRAPVWHQHDADSTTLRRVADGADAMPIFPALVHAFETGDGKHPVKKRVKRIETMLAWLKYFYGPNAARAAEAYLLAHCPAFETEYNARKARLERRGRKPQSHTQVQPPVDDVMATDAA